MAQIAEAQRTQQTSGDVMGLAAKLYPDIEIKTPADVAPFVNDQRLLDAVKGAGS